MSKVWTGEDGSPLKFQDGDYVVIEGLDPYAESPREGWVRGVDVVTGLKPAYLVYSTGRESPMIIESALKKMPEDWVPGHRHSESDRPCGICGFLPSEVTA